MFVSINPATGETIQEYQGMTRAQVDGIISQAHQAFLHWRTVDFATRANYMRRAAQLLRDRAADYGRLMAQEMGKPVKDGRAEAEKWLGPWLQTGSGR